MSSHPTLPLQQSSPTIPLPLIAYFTAVTLTLSWTGSVITSAILYGSPARGNPLPAPALSDASRYPAQHPFYVLVMAFSMSLVMLLATLLRTVQSPQDIIKRRLATIGWLCGLGGGIMLPVGTATFVGWKCHRLVIGTGAVLLWAWAFGLLLVPPRSDRRWSIVLLAVSLAASLVGAGFWSSYVYVGRKIYVAVGQYLVLGSFSVLLVALGWNVSGLRICIADVPAAMNKIERVDEGSRSGESETV